jgi:hypothetical protein
MAKTDPHKTHSYSQDYILITALQSELMSLPLRRKNDNITPIIEEYLRDRVKELKDRWK